MNRLTVLLLADALAGAGYRSIGPKKVTADRFNYCQSLADSWKNQMLLNIVKVRYLDLPIFLDVGQLVSGYTLETSVNLGGTFTSGGFRGTGKPAHHHDSSAIGGDKRHNHNNPSMTVHSTN